MVQQGKRYDGYGTKGGLSTFLLMTGELTSATVDIN